MHLIDDVQLDDVATISQLILTAAFVPKSIDESIDLGKNDIVKMIVGPLHQRLVALISGASIDGMRVRTKTKKIITTAVSVQTPEHTVATFRFSRRRLLQHLLHDDRVFDEQEVANIASQNWTVRKSQHSGIEVPHVFSTQMPCFHSLYGVSTRDFVPELGDGGRVANPRGLSRVR